MALLWDGKLNLKLLTMKQSKKIQNPSPTKSRCATDKKIFAQILHQIIEGRSLLIFFRRKVRAGMTVEASVALPIFICFVLNLASLMEIIRLHGNLQYALWNTGNRTALYACGAEEGVLSSVLSAVYIRTQVISLLGEEYLESSPLKNGKSGLLISSAVEEDTLEITAVYRVEPLCGLVGFPAFSMTNSYYAHLWNGYELPETAETQQVVYVTEYGTVYHEDRNCSHLVLSISEAAGSSIDELRNQWGEVYTACGKCAVGEMPASVFITQEGECYHYTESCSSLKRTVSAMVLEEAAKRYRSCSRCSGA